MPATYAIFRMHDYDVQTIVSIYHIKNIVPALFYTYSAPHASLLIYLNRVSFLKGMSEKSHND
jgi:hypothetical protein